MFVNQTKSTGTHDVGIILWYIQASPSLQNLPSLQDLPQFPVELMQKKLRFHIICDTIDSIRKMVNQRAFPSYITEELIIVVEALLAVTHKLNLILFVDLKSPATWTDIVYGDGRSAKNAAVFQCLTTLTMIYWLSTVHMRGIWRPKKTLRRPYYRLWYREFNNNPPAFLWAQNAPLHQ